MADTISITINLADTASKNQVIDGFVKAHGWTANVPDGAGGEIPNPETKAQAARRYILNYVKSQYRQYKINEAAETARLDAIAAATTAADAIIID